MEQMRALLLGKSVRCEQVDLPALQQGWMRLRVQYAGICGSDLHRIRRPVAGSAPVILGHEFTGTVQAIRGKSEHRIGETVAGCPLLPCSTCEACTDGHENLCHEFRAIGRNVSGAFAEFVDLPTGNAEHLPEDLDARTAVLADVIAVCIHAMRDVRVQGARHLIIGDGSVGCALALMLKRAGAARVDLVGHHQPAAHLLQGMEQDIRCHTQAKNCADACYDTVFECVGGRQSETLSEAFRCAKRAGKIVTIGVYPPEFTPALRIRRLLEKEVALTSSVAYNRPEFSKAVTYLQRNPDLHRLITHEFPLEEHQRALKLLQRMDDTATVKVLFTP
jgi:threonine dehydrogenase-like Zn-dependent dehydrogenase